MATIFYRIFIATLLGVSCCAGALMFIAHNKCIDFSVLEHDRYGRPSIVLDDEGNEWARFQIDHRDPIRLDQMPPHLIQAFIAAEDWNFFNHIGISFKGIVRSLLVNIYHRRKVQGASTITQQLVRLLFFDAQKTFTRKIKEQVFAILVELQFTKEQILETYLNHVFFGCGIYGVQAACQRFWAKDAAEVTIDEAAVLAAIMRSPNRYCPLLHLQAAQSRRNVVLNSMHKLKFITDEEYAKAKAVQLHVKEQEKSICAPHVKETIRIFMEELVGKKMLYSGGLVIQTTLNTALQHKAQNAFAKHFALLRKDLLPEVDGALISLEVKTGKIKALIGGLDFSHSKFNRALQARRQMGSTFKLLVYAAALQAGMSFADLELDEPIEFAQSHGTLWTPKNVSERFHGPMTLARALSTSNNIVAIKTFLKVRATDVIALAQKCHIKGPFQPYPSLALGCVDATLKEVAGMFNVFASNGIYVEPHLISWVKNSLGKKIWRHECVPERVMSSSISGQVAKVLELGLQRIRTRFPDQTWLDVDVMSKTGTTNDSRNCWFTGSTPELTTAIFVGHDNNISMGHNIFPVRTAFPIWLALHQGLPATQKKFIYDPALHEICINDLTGETAQPNDPHAITVFVP